MGKHKRRRRLVEYFEEQAGRCAYCLTGMTLDLGHSHTATIDHIVPKSHGGTKRGHNEICACFKCNNSKGDMPLVLWLARPKKNQEQMELSYE